VHDEVITVRCVCGWETTGAEDDVVLATAEHGSRLHNMTPTHDEVLAMAVAPPHDSPATPPGPD
jgi:hypothetical protein